MGSKLFDTICFIWISRSFISSVIIWYELFYGSALCVQTDCDLSV